MRDKAVICAALLLGLGCARNTDLTVPPPPPATPEGQAAIAPARDDGRLAEEVRPEHYRLSLDIDPRADRFGGDVVIDVSLSRPTQVIVLHGAEISVTHAEVIAGAERTPLAATFRASAGATQQQEELVLVAPDVLPSGELQLHISYEAPLPKALRGIYRVEEEGHAYVFTQLEPSDARRMFPCFDDPAFKVPFDVSVTVPKGNEVFANTPELERRPVANGERMTFRFATSKPMPTYLVALAIGPLEVRKGSTSPVPIRLITTEGKGRMGGLALSVAEDLLGLLADYLGTPYPYAKLDLVAAPNFGPGGMENVGLIVFREELLLLDEKNASAKARRDLAMLMAHELAHMWFGNLVTMQWWDDLWLNEGLASYIEAVVVDRYKPEMRASLEALSYTGRVMSIDGLPSARAVRQPVSNTYQAEEVFDGITYVKGAAVMGMLHAWMGDAPFRAGLRGYLRDNAWGNARAEQLFAALGSASGKDVQSVARTFLDQPGVPLVRASVSCERGAPPRIELSQERYRGRGGAGSVEDDPLWSVPVCVEAGRVQAGRSKRDNTGERVCGLLSERSTTLELPAGGCPSWLLPNAGYAGYYRYAMSVGDLESLSAVSQKAGGLLQIGFISNLWALVQSGDVPAAVMLQTLSKAGDLRDYAVATELVGALTRVSGSLVEEPVRPAFQRLVVTLLLPAAKRLGWQPRAGESEDDGLLRRRLLSALAEMADDPWLRAQGVIYARAFLESISTKQPGDMDADLAAVALMVAARSGDLEFDELEAALGRVESPRQRTAVVQGLSSFSDPGELRKTLALVADGTIRAQDSIYVARTAAKWPDSRAILIQWLEHNLADIAVRYPGFGTARMVSTLRRICDADARSAAERTFAPILEKLGSSERRLRQALEAADQCIELRARQGSSVTAYLGKR